MNIYYLQNHIHHTVYYMLVFSKTFMKKDLFLTEAQKVKSLSKVLTNNHWSQTSIYVYKYTLCMVVF